MYWVYRACLHGVGDLGLVGLVSFVFTLWRTQNKRNLDRGPPLHVDRVLERGSRGRKIGIGICLFLRLELNRILVHAQVSAKRGLFVYVRIIADVSYFLCHSRKTSARRLY